VASRYLGVLGQSRCMENVGVEVGKHRARLSSTFFRRRRQAHDYQKQRHPPISCTSQSLGLNGIDDMSADNASGLRVQRLRGGTVELAAD
jgi:hypothetical protein